jgi:anhydro-N-acetylmuramic acid kinase
VQRVDPEVPRLWLGLNSGTSADALDLVLLEVCGAGAARRIRQRAFGSRQLPPELQQAVRAGGDWAALARLHGALGRFFGQAARAFLTAQGVEPAELVAAASHGQTVFHHDGDPAGGTLQLGAPAMLAAELGAAVAADFRWADLAVGGQGAPISPWADRALLGDETERVVLNLGGIANLTWLRPGAAPQAWDAGPANGPLDALCREALDEPCDRDGRRAAAGQVLESLLEALQTDPFFALRAPKSTGLEAHGGALATRARALAGPEATLEDLLATLVELVAWAVSKSLRDAGWRGSEVLLCGGGRRNPALVAALERHLHEAQLAPFQACGVDGDSREAAVFALLGDALLLGEPATWPSTTGGRCPTVLGSWSPVPVLDRT